MGSGRSGYDPLSSASITLCQLHVLNPGPLVEPPFPPPSTAAPPANLLWVGPCCGPCPDRPELAAFLIQCTLAGVSFLALDILSSDPRLLPGAGEMVWLVKCLRYSPEDPSSIPRAHVKSWAWWHETLPEAQRPASSA